MSQWVEKRLGEIIKVNPESVPSKYNGKIQYIEISSVESGQLKECVEYDFSDAPGRARRVIKSGDTIISTVRPNLRGYWYVKECSNNTIVSTGFAVLRANDKNVSRFIYYLVTQNAFIDYLTLVAKGSNYPAVDSKDFKRAKISVPPLPTQTRIAEILSAYDELIENNNRRIALLEKAARDLYREWFVRFRFPGHEKTKFINGLPEGWEINTVSSLADIKSGYAFKSEWWVESGISVVKIKDIQNNTINLSDLSFVKPIHAEKAKNFKVTAGDLLIAMTGATIGKIALVPKTDVLLVNQRVGKFFLGRQPLSRVGFLYCFFQQSNVQEQIILLSSSNSAQPNISPGDLCNIKVAYNETVISAFNSFVQPLFFEIISLQSQSQNLARQRDLLLPRLMSGKLEV